VCVKVLCQLLGFAVIETEFAEWGMCVRSVDCSHHYHVDNMLFSFWSWPLEFHWCRSAVKLYNSMLRSNSVTVQKVLQADVSIPSCWAAKVLDAFQGLRRCDVFVQAVRQSVQAVRQPIFILRHLQHAARTLQPRQSGRLHTAFIDFKQAYDTIPGRHYGNTCGAQACPPICYPLFKICMLMITF